MNEARHYQSEVDALAELLEPLGEQDFALETQFKRWTIEDVIGHLYMFDRAALLSLQSDAQFQAFYAPIRSGLTAGKSFIEVQTPWLAGLKGRALCQRWQESSLELSEAYGQADPRRRLKWAGPDMSARSSITARHMETWAHGHSVFDALGVVRVETDRLYGVCHLGVSTFGWTYANRKLAVPDPAPHVTLTSPSGAIWQWNEDGSGERISGSAVEFAQVVTQLRNVGDTALEMQGETASFWMAHAQCFAGRPVDPPQAGTRAVRSSPYLASR